MKSFADFITETQTARGHVNLLFERTMYSLIDDLEQIVKVLQEAGVIFEVVGGVAVNAHLLDAHRSRSFVTRDIDLLVRREDLPRIIAAAEAGGYRGRKMFGGFALIKPDQDLAEAVHLLFAAEKTREAQAMPNPEIHPEIKHLREFGVSVPVVRLADLIRMKLTSFRAKDEAHIEILDKCGLISAEVAAALPDVLKSRLDQARSRYSADEFDPS